MVRKRILIVNNNLSVGGVQRSLVNLINQIKDDYDITLYLFSDCGEYRKYIPPAVKVMTGPPLIMLLGLSQKQTKSLGLIYFFIRAVLVVYTKFFGNQFPLTILCSTQRRIHGFDIAISFLHNAHEKTFYGGCNEFVLKRVNAKQKITFVHCDFLNYGGNTARNREVYNHFDRIAAVSEGCRESFIKAIPELESKTYCVYNCNEFSEYKVKADINPVEYSKGGLNIVTVARLSEEKGILRAINVIKRLVDEKYNICWHIIGDGAQRSEIEKHIQMAKISENVILYGNQENPYRYIKNADIFLLPSNHEAAPMVFNEAKSLGVPIITTNTTSANEMVKDNYEGIVCGNSEEEIYNALKRVLEDSFFILRCKDYLNKQIYSNEIAVDQFFKLISEEPFKNDFS
ncbi:glycosyltransferase [Neobacillus kokaensis]|uniref:Glycosyl transferase n=1 Tax=Neobacillus kokaensis TaxID=2759023 RepID=A0ABQ3N247_9BACI|nr:glycosyltransferase [Neobacillus kokaensis]GHH97717.1 glycosyl transferase [Neobacillus kokaensis]